MEDISRRKFLTLLGGCCLLQDEKPEVCSPEYEPYWEKIIEKQSPAGRIHWWNRLAVTYNAMGCELRYIHDHGLDPNTLDVKSVEKVDHVEEMAQRMTVYTKKFLGALDVRP